MRDQAQTMTFRGARQRVQATAPVTWRSSTEPVAYPDAVAQMHRWSEEVSRGQAREQVWFLEHSPLYTAGTSARPEHLLAPNRFPVFKSGRGGEYTYHGPGQRIVYVALDVRQRFGGDVRHFVHALEDWVITALAYFNVAGQRGAGQIGVWVPDPNAKTPEPRKIASIGVRVRRGVAIHGIALNVDPNLEHYSGIVACGGDGDRPTSLAALGSAATFDEVDAALKATFDETMCGR